jgi:hypothetical protein
VNEEWKKIACWLRRYVVCTQPHEAEPTLGRRGLDALIGYVRRDRSLIDSGGNSSTRHVLAATANNWALLERLL